MLITVVEENGLFVCTEYDVNGNIRFKSYWNKVLDLIKVDTFEDDKLVSSKKSGTASFQKHYGMLKKEHGKFIESYVEEKGITVKVALRKKGTDDSYKIEEVMPTINEFIFPSSFKDLKSNYDYDIIN